MLPFSSPFSLDLIEYGGKLGEARRRDPRDDVTTRLVEAEIDGSRLYEHEFGVFFILLTTAGNETTRHTISLGLHRPARATRRRRRASSADPSLAGTAADEILRRAHPVHHFRRTATQRRRPSTGRRIAPGDKVTIWYASGNFDEEKFVDPVPPRRRPRAEPASHVRARRPAFLPRRSPREARGDASGSRRCFPTSTGSSSRDGPSGYARTSSTASSACPCGYARDPTEGRMNAGHDPRRRPPPPLRSRACARCACSTPTCTASRAARTSRSAHFADMCERGRRLLRRGDGHRPAAHAGRRRRGGVRRLRDPARPRRRFASVPWQPEVAWCLGEAWTLDGSEHWPVCPRALLRRVVDAYAERGLTPIVAPGARVLPRRARPVGAGRPAPLRRRALPRLHGRGRLRSARDRAADAALVRRARAAGVRREPRVHELAVRDQRQALGGARRRRPGVHAASAAVKEIAVREGLLATFMGRPFADQGGSGFHVHLSLADGETGATRSPTRAGRTGSARSRRRFIAGVIDHAQGLQALLGPTINAYKRILPDSLAPTHANWGHDNRTAFCRVPERARLAGPGRDPHGRRIGVPAPDHRGDPARRARRDRARARAARAGRRRRVPRRRRARRLDAARRISAPRSTRSRPTRAGRAARRRSSSRRSSR